MDERLRLPAEWEPHAACWLAFPHLDEEWTPHLAGAQQSIARLVCAIADEGGEPVRLLVRNERVEAEARSLIGDAPNVAYVQSRYGDCWIRDTAPLLGYTPGGTLGGLCFGFNGWGDKFSITHDDVVGTWMTAELRAARFESSITLEGGSLETNGQGTFLTTASCTLNENRNPGLTRSRFETALGALVLVERVVWIERGLEHDHTDGHIDMIARFISPDTVFCMAPRAGTPNEGALRGVEQALQRSGLEVLTAPAPDAVRRPDGIPLPATYCNFYIANAAVIVPTYGVAQDRTALDVLDRAFPSREVIGLPAADLLWGGGAFHCVTQPEPAPP